MVIVYGPLDLTRTTEVTIETLVLPKRLPGSSQDSVCVAGGRSFQPSHARGSALLPRRKDDRNALRSLRSKWYRRPDRQSAGPAAKGGPMHDDPGHDRRPRKRVRELGRRRHFHWPAMFPTAARAGTALHRRDGNAVVSFGNRPLVRVGRRNRLPHQISVSTTWEFSQKCRNSRGWRMIAVMLMFS